MKIHMQFLLVCLSLVDNIALANSGLHYAGEYSLATGAKQNNIDIGGLSALTWDEKKNVFYAINDNRNNEKDGKASLYTFRMDLSPEGIVNVDFIDQRPLLDKDGKDFPANTLDGEGLALIPDGKSFLWSSELGSPLRLSDKNGVMQQDFTSLFPPRFHAAGASGVRINASWESVTFTPDGKHMFMATESSLKQDGPPAAATHSGTSRLLKFSSDDTGSVLTLQQEYLYITDPVPQVTSYGINDNGVSDILAISSNRFLIVERSGRNVTSGFDNWDFNVRVYLADIDGATDISHIEALSDYKDKTTLQTVRKKLIIDFSDYTDSPDCIEGISFGPVINGKKSIVFVSDNNNQPHQKTKFYLFIDQGGILK